MKPCAECNKERAAHDSVRRLHSGEQGGGRPYTPLGPGPGKGPPSAQLSLGPCGELLISGRGQSPTGGTPFSFFLGLLQGIGGRLPPAGGMVCPVLNAHTLSTIVSSAQSSWRMRGKSRCPPNESPADDGSFKGADSFADLLFGCASVPWVNYRAQGKNFWFLEVCIYYTHTHHAYTQEG